METHNSSDRYHSVCWPANATYRLILCDTAEQIEQVFTLNSDEITFDEAIDAANKQAGRPNACSKVAVEATLLEEVRDITLRGNTYTIVKVAVTKVSDGAQMLPVPFLEQFAVMPGKKGQGARSRSRMSVKAGYGELKVIGPAKVEPTGAHVDAPQQLRRLTNVRTD